MNKIFYTIIGAVFLIACSKQPKNQFTKITVPKENFVVSYLEGFKRMEGTAGEKISYIDTLKRKRYFSIMYCEIGQGRDEVVLYTPFGANVGITAKDGKFYFSGDYKMENELLQQLDSTFFKPMVGNAKYNIYKESEKVAMSMVDSIHNAAKYLIEQYWGHLDAKFLHLVNKKMLYTAANHKNNYQMNHGYFLYGYSFENYKVPAGFYNYRASIPLEDEEALEFEDYLSYVGSTIGIDYGIDLAGDYAGNKLQSSAEKIGSLTSEKIRFELMSRLLKEYIAYHGLNGTSQRIYDDYIQKYPRAKKEVKQMYAKKVKTAVGKMAPNFTVYKTNGKEVSLSDFRGKLVYVDFWATWCGPCKYEFPHLKKLEKQYHGKEIVFLSVSLDSDRDEEKWKKMVKKESLTGVQVRSQGGFGSNISKQYSISGVPTFLLIGKQGEIISCQAPRPSSGEAGNLINRYL